MPERAPVPEDEWKKFSAQNEAGVEAERVNIRSEQQQAGTSPKKRRPTTSEDRARLDAAMASALGYSEEPLPKPGTPEANERLLNAVETGELTYEQLDQMVLKGYQETPFSERNWKRDAGFYQLAEGERNQELVAEAVRDTRALQETVRAAIHDPEKNLRLRKLLDEVANELQNEPGH